ncbi:MAG: hydrogenase expression/formation protein HypE [Lachnospiraceae bacterium]|nr:hydrogenase expression/formation protein HypE [Lachnospiraceae bacterium]
MSERISMIHGSGGAATAALIRDIFTKEYGGEALESAEDASVVIGAPRIAITTDSFVVSPLFYPGGDIGRLCVCGTVNDLLMRGAEPRYITAGFVIEEGAEIEALRQIAHSLAETAREAGVEVVCGDTKVVEGDEGVFINTTGVGFVSEEVDIAASGAKAGDCVLVSGTMGDHHAAILSRRLAVENSIESDNAPLVETATKLRSIRTHSMRDVTRGGLATVLKELAEASGKEFRIFEEKVPVSDAVRDFSGILGLNPLYMGNEGKMVAIVDPADAKHALEAMRGSRYGENAALIGEVREGEPGAVVAQTRVGGLRKLSVLQDEGLPRIC